MITKEQLSKERESHGLLAGQLALQIVQLTKQLEETRVKFEQERGMVLVLESLIQNGDFSTPDATAKTDKPV